jgi:hypothetical protein
MMQRETAGDHPRFDCGVIAAFRVPNPPAVFLHHLVHRVAADRSGLAESRASSLRAERVVASRV